MAQNCGSCNHKSDQFIIKFNLRLGLIFYLDEKKKAIGKNPERLEDRDFIQNFLFNSEKPEQPLKPGEFAAKISKYLGRKHIQEQVFRRYHISMYQGDISPKAKKVISDIWNQLPFNRRRTLTNIYIPPLSRAALLENGLIYKGNIISLFYDANKKTTEADSTLEAFLKKDKEVILVRISRRRMLSLKTLAAESISLSLKNVNDLKKLVNSTIIPIPCTEAIEKCI